MFGIQTVSGIRKLWADSAICNQFAESSYICRISLHLRNSEQLYIFARCGICNIISIPTKFTLQIFVHGIRPIFVSGIHLHFGTSSKTCLWNPGTYRHKILRLSSEQFGLVMKAKSPKQMNIENILQFQKIQVSSSHDKFDCITCPKKNSYFFKNIIC